MIKLDARALRLVCHNFATFSRAMEAADSSYKGFCTVDVTLPSEIIPELNVVTQLEIRTKYMGMGLSESGIAEVQVRKGAAAAVAAAAAAAAAAALVATLSPH